MTALMRPSTLFGFTSVDLVRPPDKLPAGRYARATNVRSYTEGTLQTRGGLVAISAAALADLTVHSPGRLNDPTAFNGGTTAIRVLGAGTNVYWGGVNGPFVALDSGYSGDPLAFHEATPPRSPQPWLYIADRSRQRKVKNDGTNYPIGIAQPNLAPAVALAAPGTTIISDFGSAAAWTAAGTVAAAPANENRVNTTIAAILYDTGNTGWASISATANTFINEGVLLVLGAAETVLVTRTTIAVASTTIGSIIYDSGTSGLCTIQPAASLGVGQLESPPLSVYENRAGYAVARPQAEGPPRAPGSTDLTARIRQMDFPVDCLITLGGATETVRILSVAVGADGVQSFRCSTANTHAAGNTITGVTAFRAYLTTTRAATNTIVGAAINNVLTPVTASTPMTGGVQAVLAVDLSLINGRATLEDDDLHLSIRVNRLTEVQSIRMYFDVDAATNDFLHNYFFFEWHANDIVAAIQATNAAQVTTLVGVQTTAVTNTQLSDALPPRNQDGGGSGRRGEDRGVETIVNPNTNKLPVDSTAAQLGLGNDQWIELKCKVRDLVRVGADTSRTLANVAGVEVLIGATSATALTIHYDSLWLGGGFGPDVGNIGQPFVYCYRYRSTATGARSNPSPPSRAGVLPRRGRVSATGTQSADTQVDVVDWFRFGGTLTRWTYSGSGTNAATPAYDDDNADQAIDGGETLTFDDYQPWPTTDLPRSGTCNVAGTAVSRVSGDTFNALWAPGTVVIVNGRACTLYASPASTSILHLNENVGSGTAVAFTIPSPTLLSQNLPTLWGDLNGSHFACGDANNPGVLYWSKPNDLDVASDRGSLVVPDAQAAEPLQNGCIVDRGCFVGSTENVYEILPDSDGGFRAERTACTKGFWSRWSNCVAGDFIYFLASDGIYRTARGAAAISITDDFLRPLFPHDGQPGIAVNGYNPPDMTATTSLRLGYDGRYVYFDYLDSQAVPQTLAYDTRQPGWVFDHYQQDATHPGATVHVADDGPASYGTVIAGRDGRIYHFSSPGVDRATAFTCVVRTGSPDLGDSRSLKYYQDLMLDLDTGGIAVALTAGFDNFSQQLALASNITQIGRSLVGVSIQNGAGYTAHNLGLEFTWAGSGYVLLYEWQPRLIAEPLDFLAAAWQTKGSSLGLSGYGHLRDGYIAYSSQVPVTLTIVVDGVPIIATPNPLPATGGVYQKAYIVFPALKGKVFTPFLLASAGFEFFPRDSQFRAKSWGSSNPYMEVNPFLTQYSGAVGIGGAV